MKKLAKVMNLVFVMGLITFMCLSSILVILQIYRALTLNGSLAIIARNLFAKPVFATAALTGLTGFAAGYFRGSAL